MTFRFIHTADVHLDSPLTTLALKDEAAADAVANATRQAFANTVDLCIDEGVDALLISGDLYDGKLRSMKTAAFFTGEMQRVTEAGILVFIVRGNHDAESRITKHLELPEGVHVFSARGGTVVLNELNVAIHGISFPKPHVPESLLAKYKPPVDGLINIGLLHTSLAGDTEHDVYSPCSVQQLHDQGYDYWALGHIHKREVHATTPSTIVMPGILQGRHIRESGPKSVTYGEIDDDGSVRIEERHTSIAQFERLLFDVTDCSEWKDLIEALEKALKVLLDGLCANHLITRIELQGQTVLAARLRRDRDVLIEEARLVAQRCGPVFVEEVQVKVDPLPPSDVASTSDPITELRSLIAAGSAGQSQAETDAVALLETLQKNLPPELRDAFGEDDQQSRQMIAEMMAEGASEVLARLESAGVKD